MYHCILLCTTYISAVLYQCILLFVVFGAEVAKKLHKENHFKYNKYREGVIKSNTQFIMGKSAMIETYCT
jgi:hypothetical protein